MSFSGKKINLYQAAADLEKICEVIDNLDDIGPLVKALFDEQKESLEDSVDRRISYLHHLDNASEGAKKMVASWQNRIKVLENTRQRILDYTADVLRTLPNLRYKGSLGELRLQANGGKRALELREDYQRVSGDFINGAIDGLDPEFLQPGFKLDLGKIRERLESGESLEFATLKERGQSVRVVV